MVDRCVQYITHSLFLCLKLYLFGPFILGALLKSTPSMEQSNQNFKTMYSNKGMATSFSIILRYIDFFKNVHDVILLRKAYISLYKIWIFEIQVWQYEGITLKLKSSGCEKKKEKKFHFKWKCQYGHSVEVSSIFPMIVLSLLSLIFFIA